VGSRGSLGAPPGESRQPTVSAVLALFTGELRTPVNTAVEEFLIDRGSDFRQLIHSQAGTVSCGPASSQSRGILCSRVLLGDMSYPAGNTFTDHGSDRCNDVGVLSGGGAWPLATDQAGGGADR
jgi:hypothetical protein